jgi:hypothetical protein
LDNSFYSDQNEPVRPSKRGRLREILGRPAFKLFKPVREAITGNGEGGGVTVEEITDPHHP